MQTRGLGYSIQGTPAGREAEWCAYGYDTPASGLTPDKVGHYQHR